MKITHYLYNSFIIDSGNKKIAIDPGGLMFYFFRFTTVIPKSEWKSITHIFVTHGDPDHYWHMDRVAKASNAVVICNKTMVKNIGGKTLMLGPRDKGLAFTTPMEKIHTISVDETIQLDGMSITGTKATHGVVTFKVGPLSKTFKPGPGERVGWGAIGFNIQFDGKSVVNLGDTLLHENEWQSIRNPDVLMVPIGGNTVHNTMDEREAIQAVKIIQPKLVIPCHYNCPALFSKKYNPADDKMFKEEVEKMGIECVILRKGDSIEI
ncbi:MAG: MBL fold metallo-hydrolase [Gammaproteobacteria bacterium]|nr:MBL fold metallo-hydrolase [Gammaproteobacteria bacterium]MBQ0841262.1 MBL fold metallo-hydrolase [Gammaproteobacteria bacterium]